MFVWTINTLSSLYDYRWLNPPWLKEERSLPAFQWKSPSVLSSVHIGCCLPGSSTLALCWLVAEGTAPSLLKTLANLSSSTTSLKCPSWRHTRERRGMESPFRLFLNYNLVEVLSVPSVFALFTISSRRISHSCDIITAFNAPGFGEEDPGSDIPPLVTLQ